MHKRGMKRYAEDQSPAETPRMRSRREERKEKGHQLRGNLYNDIIFEKYRNFAHTSLSISHRSFSCICNICICQQYTSIKLRQDSYQKTLWSIRYNSGSEYVSNP